MSTIGDRIKEARLRKRMRQWQLAEAVGVSQPSVRKWESGGAPDRTRIPAIARVLEVDKIWLEFGEGNANVKDALTTTVYCIGKVQAGEWVEAVENPRDEWETLYAPVDPRYPSIPRFALKVVGDSMDQIMPDGTYAICASLEEIGRPPKDGEFVVIERRRKDGLVEGTIKQFVMDADGKAWLWPRSTRPEYQQPVRYGTRNDETVLVTAVVLSFNRLI